MVIGDIKDIERFTPELFEKMVNNMYNILEDKEMNWKSLYKKGYYSLNVWFEGINHPLVKNWLKENNILSEEMVADGWKRQIWRWDKKQMNIFKKQIKERKLKAKLDAIEKDFQ